MNLSHHLTTIENMIQERKGTESQKLRKKQRGQALLEYALTILVVLGMYRIMDHQIRKSIGKMWTYMAQNIAAACPVPSAGRGCQNSIPEELK